MKSKPAVGMLVLLAVGLITWSLTTTVAASVAGSRDAFLDWRSDNTTLFFGIWLAEVIVVGLPVLWFVGRRMSAYADQQDKAAVAARGVGRLAGQALRGDKKSIAHLVKLLDDGTPAVRYQSARALAMLDDKAANEELFRKVRYWDVDHKLGLIDVLRRTMDLRTVKLLRTLTDDRNPMVARKARTALGIVSSRSSNIDDLVAKRRKQAQAKAKKAGQKSAAKTAGSATTKVASPAPAHAPHAGTETEGRSAGTTAPAAPQTAPQTEPEAATQTEPEAATAPESPPAG